MTDDVRVQIETNVSDVRRRIAAACRDAGRTEGEVTLVAVTKTFPAAYVQVAADAGLTEVAESKAQEGAAKSAELPGLAVRWHFVGRLQRNKVKAVVQFADVVQSVDRSALVDALGRAAAASDRFGGGGRRLQVLLQVDLDPAPPAAEGKDSTAARGGVHPDSLSELADRVVQFDALELAGVMAIAPLDAEPAAAFARLRDLSERLRQSHPDARVVSAGMSADFAVAIANGATWVRVGTALFGGRQLISATDAK